MRFSARLQLLTCLVLYASCAHAIMVKFGTKGGPIEPPPPEPVLPPTQPYRAPAPVWEERLNDNPDPNAQWRPQLFISQPRYTQVLYTGQPLPLNNAQRFVNAYIPQHQPIQPKPIQPGRYFTPSQVLSSQSLPGFGLRYFLPTYRQEPKETRQEDAKINAIDSNNDIDRRDSSSELQWQFEKDLTKRDTQEGSPSFPYVYQFPAHVARHH